MVKCIKAGLLDPQTLHDFQNWFHREEPFDAEQYDKDCETVEADWHDRFDDRAHDALCATPAYIAHDNAPTMWSDTGVTEAAARTEGETYTSTYFRGAQFVFSRVQHHIHKRTKTGYQPLGTCLKKGLKKPKCGFPKTKQISERSLVTCCGNARCYDLWITGRRNSLGAILGRRTRPTSTL